MQQFNEADKPERLKIPENIDYKSIRHISAETRDKPEKIRPVTLRQASRIGGVKPADISVPMIMIEAHNVVHNKKIFLTDCRIKTV